MILKALYDYYNRRDDLPRLGIELKEIGFLIVIDREGKFLRIESRMVDNKTATKFAVIQTIKRSGKKYVPNYLWDNYEYVIGGSSEGFKKNQTFVNMIEVLHSQIKQNEYLDSICKFYHNYSDIEELLKNDILFDSMSKSNKNISFLLQGAIKIAAEDEDVKRMVLNKTEEGALSSICLITGGIGTVARLHSTIKLSKDTGPLVSFKTDRGYDSYGKQQCYNAPISVEAEFAYSTALNAMLSKDSHNKFRVGKRTFLFWASSNSEAAEQAEERLFDLLGIAENNDDDPNARVEQVRKVFNAIYSGSLKTTLDDHFYILGIAPNAARIAVVYWSETSLKDFAGMILRHFNDMEIVQDNKGQQKFYRGLNDMLSGVTRHNNDGKWKDNITPNLPEAIVKSIFQGYPYPFTLFSSCIRRIQAESADKNSVYAVRAAIIKAYLNRLNDNNKKILTMLDKENTNPGYLCGRLFAVLDKIQEDANHISSIRERYMNAASATPATVFATILNLSVHHAEKLNEGSKVFYEKLKQEIICKLPADAFPTHLDLQEQGRFFVGYYHQRQEFFLKKDNQNE